ncbi:vitamin D3 receptor-like [Littorina saxatilis]|uniref:vitamin D3 receptor-like n=1 Tax=Littorina saxatilis TaxID=31220 RepID=UPI0038B6323E
MVCAYCRFQWCLTQGMSRDSIKLGRYTCSKRRQDSQEITRSSAVTPLSVTDQELDKLTEQLMTSHEKVLTNWDLPEAEMEQMAKARQEKVQLEEELFGHQNDVSAEEYDQIYRQTGLDIDGRGKVLRHYAQCMERQIRGFVHFAKGVPGFGDLALEDQVSLIKASHAELWFLGIYRGFIHKYQTFVSPMGFCIHIKEDSPCFSSDLAQTEHDTAFMLNRRLKLLTKGEIVLLKSVCLMSPDRCELKDKEKVEEIHWKLVCALLKSLRRNHGRTGKARNRNSCLENEDNGRHAQVCQNITENQLYSEGTDVSENGQVDHYDITRNDVSGQASIDKLYAATSMRSDVSANGQPDNYGVARNDVNCFASIENTTRFDLGQSEKTYPEDAPNARLLGLNGYNTSIHYATFSQTGYLPDITHSSETCSDDISSIASDDVNVNGATIGGDEVKVNDVTIGSDDGKVNDVTLFSYVIDCLMELRTLTEREKKAHENTPLMVDIFQNHPMLVEVMLQ